MRAFLGVLLILPLLLCGSVAGPASAGTARSLAVRTIRYDATHAAEFRSVVDQGAQIWNRSLHNVRFMPGKPADVIVYADKGWPRAQLTELGRGRIWMGRQAVNEGHYPLRIAAHEFGHILGLPDNRSGRCGDLMSGHSAGTSCRNARPSTKEALRADANFRNGTSGVPIHVSITDADLPASPTHY